MKPEDPAAAERSSDAIRPHARSRGGGARGGYWLTWMGLALATLAPLAVPTLLPLTDLPQHALVVESWLDLDQPAVRTTHELHATPYLATYAIARAVCSLAPAVQPLQALVALAALAILALPLAAREVARRVGADPWWSLLAFPVATGFSFQWGLIPFLVALPLVVLVVAQAIDVGRAERAGWWRLAATLVALALTHPLAFSVAICLAGGTAALVGWDAGGRRAPRPRQWALALAAAVFAACVFVLTRDAVDWNLGLLRLGQLPGLALGPEVGDFWPLLGGWVSVGLLVLLSGRVSSAAGLRVATLGLAAFLLTPASVWSSGYLLYQRLAGLALLLLLCAVAAPRGARRVLARLVVVATVVAHAALYAARLHCAGPEIEDLVAIAGGVDEGESVLGVVRDGTSSCLPGHPWVHAAAWAAALRGAEPGFRFTEFRHLPVRTRSAGPGTDDLRRRWTDWTVDPRVDGDFDAYLVREAPPDEIRLLTESMGLQLVDRQGRWSLYRPPAGADRSELGRATRPPA